jgi:hypothetical protein
MSGNDKLIVVFDDMCHLLRYIELRQHEHPTLLNFMDQVVPTCDTFHFDKNHKGAYCHQRCNPHKVEALNAIKGTRGGRNLSMAEQQFSILGRHRRSLNHMNRARFQFMLMKIADLDHAARKEGVVRTY